MVITGAVVWFDTSARCASRVSWCTKGSPRRRGPRRAGCRRERELVGWPCVRRVGGHACVSIVVDLELDEAPAMAANVTVAPCGLARAVGGREQRTRPQDPSSKPRPRPQRGARTGCRAHGYNLSPARDVGGLSQSPRHADLSPDKSVHGLAGALLKGVMFPALVGQSDAALTQSADGRLDVFYVGGANRELVHMWESSTGTWSHEILGNYDGPLQGGPAAVSQDVRGLAQGRRLHADVAARGDVDGE